LGSLDINRKEGPGAAGEVFDVPVAAVFPGRNSAGRFFGNAFIFPCTGFDAPEYGVLWFRGQCQRRDSVRVLSDQFSLPFVPFFQQFVGRGRSQDSGMGDGGYANSRNVPGTGINSVEIPNRLMGVGEMVGKETASIFFGKDAGISPILFRMRSDI